MSAYNQAKQHCQHNWLDLITLGRCWQRYMPWRINGEES